MLSHACSLAKMGPRSTHLQDFNAYQASDDKEDVEDAECHPAVHDALALRMAVRTEVVTAGACVHAHIYQARACAHMCKHAQDMQVRTNMRAHVDCTLLERRHTQRIRRLSTKVRCKECVQSHP